MQAHSDGGRRFGWQPSLAKGLGWRVWVARPGVSLRSSQPLPGGKSSLCPLERVTQKAPATFSTASFKDCRWVLQGGGAIKVLDVCMRWASPRAWPAASHPTASPKACILLLSAKGRSWFMDQGPASQLVCLGEIPSPLITPKHLKSYMRGH